MGIKPAETSIQTFEELNVRGAGRLLCLERTIGGNRLLDARVDLPEVFEQHELRDDVAVVRRGGVRDCTFFFEPPGHSVQRVIGERVGVEALLALEVADQPAPDIDVTPAARVESAVEPGKQPVERTARWNPVAFQIGRDARTP